MNGNRVIEHTVILHSVCVVSLFQVYLGSLGVLEVKEDCFSFPLSFSASLKPRCLDDPLSLLYSPVKSNIDDVLIAKRCFKYYFFPPLFQLAPSQDATLDLQQLKSIFDVFILETVLC